MGGKYIQGIQVCTFHPSWKVHTWIEICASLNNRKKTKADGSRLIPRKHTETLVLLSECRELMESYLAGGNRIINFHRQTNRNRHNWNIWHSTWSTLFIRITSVFSYLYCKKTNTLHLCSMRGGIKTLKHNVRTTLQLSYHGCKYLTHTSKTPQVKRTQMVVTVRFTIRVTSLPRWNKQVINICDWFLAYYTCGVKLLEYRYAQVWNIAKRRKQSPIGWFL